MGQHFSSSDQPDSRGTLAFWLVAFIVSLTIALIVAPGRPVLAAPLLDDPATIVPIAEEGSTGLMGLVTETSPNSIITHEKGNLHWLDRKPADPSTYSIDAGSCTVSPMDHAHKDYKPDYWDRAFVVTSADGHPCYKARYNDVLAWVNPTTGETQSMDFEVEFKTLELHPGVANQDVEVRQYFANGFFTTGIAHAEVTYRIYAHGSDTPIDPGLFAYWCRSLNPGETVAFSQSQNPGLSLAAAYLTKNGIYGRDFINDPNVVNPSTIVNHWGTSSVIVDNGDPDLLKFTGVSDLRCPQGSILDVADGPQEFGGPCPDHQFVAPSSGDTSKPDLVFHGIRIPYEEYIQYRAVTFDIAPGATSNDGLTLDYFCDTDFYWEMEFNGIVVTRHLPTKTVQEPSTALLPGNTVSFAISQSMGDIPAGLVKQLVFEDTLPEELEFTSAVMLVDGTDVTDKAGKLDVSGNTVTYRFSDEGLGLLSYGTNASDCTLLISAKIKSDVPYETKIANVADVTMGNDKARTPEAVVTVAPEPEPEPEPEPTPGPSVDVEPAKGILLIRKDVETPNNSGKAEVGDRVDYVVSVQNDGNATLRNVVIQDSLPEGLILKDEPRLTDANRKTLTTGDCEYWEGQILPDGGIVQLPETNGGTAQATQVDASQNEVQAVGPSDERSSARDAGQTANQDARQSTDLGTTQTPEEDEGQSTKQASGDEVTALGYVWSGTVLAKVPKLAPGDVVHVELSAAIGENATPIMTNVALAMADNHSAVSDEASVQILRPEDSDEPKVDDPNDNSTDPGNNSNGGGSDTDDPGANNQTPNGTDGSGSGDTNQPGNTGSQGSGTGTGTGAVGDNTAGTGYPVGGYATGAYPSSGTGYPVYQDPIYPESAEVPASSGQAASSSKAKKLPQTDTLPTIQIATTSGIGMTGAFLLSCLRDNHRHRW